MSRFEELSVTENLYDKSSSTTNMIGELKASAMDKWSEDEKRIYCDRMSSCFLYTECILLPRLTVTKGSDSRRFLYSKRNALKYNTERKT